MRCALDSPCFSVVVHSHASAQRGRRPLAQITTLPSIAQQHHAQPGGQAAVAFAAAVEQAQAADSSSHVHALACDEVERAAPAQSTAGSLSLLRPAQSGISAPRSRSCSPVHSSAAHPTNSIAAAPQRAQSAAPTPHPSGKRSAALARQDASDGCAETTAGGVDSWTTALRQCACRTVG